MELKVNRLVLSVGIAVALTWGVQAAVTVARFPGEAGAKTGWRLVSSEAGKVVYIPFEGYYESKGGRIESPRFKLDKPADENAYYRLTFSAKCETDGYWWVDLYDAKGNLLPDINSRLYASKEWRHYDVMVPARPDAAEAVIAFVSSCGAFVRDVEMSRVSVDEAAAWCDKTYATLPQIDFKAPGNCWEKAPKARAALTEGRDLNVVLLGDSIMNDTYCGLFTALVQRAFPKSKIKFTLSVRGSTGCWYYHEKANFEEYVAKYKPDLVLIGGISNYLGKQRNQTLAQAEDWMAETIGRCQAIGAEVIVCTPPPSYEFRKDSKPMPFDRSLTSPTEDEACKWLYLDYELRAAARTAAQVWDLTTGPCDAISRSGKPLGWFKRDRAHNDDRGKQLIAQTIASYFLSALASEAAASRPEPSQAQKDRISSGVELYGIVHWGLNTYTDREWGYGDENPQDLNPAKFDADQIVGACAAGGLQGLVVVAKHHDGFCLWPTKTTGHNIAKSPFRGGKGNYVKEMEQACRRHGLRFGVYVSPWDRNNAAYGAGRYVTEVFQVQIRELLSGDYGEIFEMWFDGANGGDGYYGGARETRKIPTGYYRYATETFAMVRKLQPQVCIFNEMDEADFRWPGNEKGEIDPESRSTGGRFDIDRYDDYMKWANKGRVDGSTFHPAEADFPLRPGWFYHAKDKGKTKSASYLMNRYLTAVGNAASMNLGIAPNRDGLLDGEDVRALKGFGELQRVFFSRAAKDDAPFNVIVMKEDVSRGEMVDSWRLLADGREVLSGKSIGIKRIRALAEPITAAHVEVKATSSAGTPGRVDLARYYVDPALLREVLSATTDSGETDTAKWMTDSATASSDAAKRTPMRVVLTFDDGLKDHLLIAAPELEKRGWRGTFNVVTDWIGKDDRFMTWEDVSELVSRGHEVATHTVSHPNLVAQLKAGMTNEVRRQLAASRNLIAERTGFAPRYMCAPFVGQDETTDLLCREAGLRQMNVPRHNFGANNAGSIRAVVTGEVAKGSRRMDILHHGVSAADHGGWCSFPDRASFSRHLDGIGALEREGSIVVTDYDGCVSDCELKAGVWPRHSNE